MLSRFLYATGIAVLLSVGCYAWGEIEVQIVGYRPLSVAELESHRVGDWWETCTATTANCPGMTDQCTGHGGGILGCGGFGQETAPMCYKCQAPGVSYKLCGGSSYTWCNDNASGVVPCGAMQGGVCLWDLMEEECICPAIGPGFTDDCPKSDCT